MLFTIQEKKSLPGSEFFLHIEIPHEEIGKHRNHALAHLKKDATLPGFRKGFVPEKILREHVGETALWEDASTEALSEVLAQIFKDEKLDVIGRPRVEAVKLTPEQPAEFKVTLSLYPELTLPDYKKIATEQNKRKQEIVVIGEKEIDSVVQEITKQHETASGAKEFAVTDESVKAFGKFETVIEFRTKVKEGLLSHREERNKEKRRAELLDALTEKAKGEIPNVLIDSELVRMESELRAQIEKMGGSFDEYLKEIKKDDATLKKEWRIDAERRARLQLVMFQIARAEKLTASEAQVEEEVKHLLEHYKNAKPENVQSYIETLLTNQKVLAFLEEQK